MVKKLLNMLTEIILFQTDDYPSCIPAPCVNLHNERVAHGIWKCEPDGDPSERANTHEVEH